MNEERLVAWLAARTARSGRGRSAGIGDDTATLPRWRGREIVTVDQQIEGIHFPAGLDPRIVARRLLAVNLSDLAASGAVPRHAFLALAAPAGFDHRAFFTSLLAAAQRHGVELAGGDLARSPSLHLSLTLVGERLPGEATLGRDRARVGHVIWIGGSLGESSLGQRIVARGARPRGNVVSLPALFSNKGKKLRAAAVRAVRRHLEPEPQVELGRWLARLGPRRAGAAIDISDGFAKDLHRLCAASGTGAKIDLEALDAATPPPFTELCAALGENASELRDGGEDYVLLFTLPKRIAPPPELDCLPIGVVTRERTVRVVDAKGRARPLRVRGWDHLSNRTATIRK